MICLLDKYGYVVAAGNLYVENDMWRDEERVYGFTSAYRSVEADSQVGEQIGTPLVTVTDYSDAVQNLLDTQAKARGYDGILSVSTYANSTVARFQNDALEAIKWRDQCWAICYQILDAVQAGTRKLPTIEELLAEMPVMTWP